MLKTISFGIKDSDGINAALSATRMAPKAQILVTEGTVLIPVEDHTEPNNKQLAAAHCETLSDLLFAQEYTSHDKTVLEAHIARMDEERMQKHVIEKKKDWEKLGAKIEEMRGIVEMKRADLEQYAVEIELRRARIAELLK